MVSALLVTTNAVFAQPAFEAASIKSAPEGSMADFFSGKIRRGTFVDKAQARILGMTLDDLIAKAYRVRVFQLTGPDWMSKARFDIVAKIPEGGTPEQVPEMLQALLKERFHLKVGRERKEMAVYALVVGKGGIKMSSVSADSDTAAKRDGPLMTIDALIGMVSRAVELPVVDGTGLEGRYPAPNRTFQELTRAWLEKDMAARGQTPEADPASRGLDGALQSLGLKLERRKVWMEALVVEHVDKIPTAN